MSNRQYEQLGRSIVDIQYRTAVDFINLSAGITDNMINPGQDKINQKNGFMQNFQRLMSTQVKNDQGVLVYPEPSVAARQAIKEYGEDKAVQTREQNRKSAEERINKFFEASKNVQRPNLPIEQINPANINRMNENDRKRLQKLIDEYKSNL